MSDGRKYRDDMGMGCKLQIENGKGAKNSTQAFPSMTIKYHQEYSYNKLNIIINANIPYSYNTDRS